MSMDAINDALVAYFARMFEVLGTGRVLLVIDDVECVPKLWLLHTTCL